MPWRGAPRPMPGSISGPTTAAISTKSRASSRWTRFPRGASTPPHRGCSSRKRSSRRARPPTTRSWPSGRHIQPQQQCQLHQDCHPQQHPGRLHEWIAGELALPVGVARLLGAAEEVVGWVHGFTNGPRPDDGKAGLGRPRNPSRSGATAGRAARNPKTDRGGLSGPALPTNRGEPSGSARPKSISAHDARGRIHKHCPPDFAGTAYCGSPGEPFCFPGLTLPRAKTYLIVPSAPWLPRRNTC